MSGQNIVSDNRTIGLPFPAGTTQAISRMDLLFWNAGMQQVNNLVMKATLSSEANDQADVAYRFAGVSFDTTISSDPTNNKMLVVWLDGVFDYDCPSQNFNPGDMVGPTWNGGTSLANQALTKVTDQALAIGVVVDPFSTTYTVLSGNPITRVRVRLTSKLCWDLISRGSNTLLGSPVVLPDASQVLTVGTVTRYMSMVPTTARNITLPSEAASAYLGVVYFTNNSAGANSVTFLGSAGGSIHGNGVTPQNKSITLWSDGQFWNGNVSS
jgi:hypothetical protein